MKMISRVNMGTLFDELFNDDIKPVDAGEITTDYLLSKLRNKRTTSSALTKVKGDTSNAIHLLNDSDLNDCKYNLKSKPVDTDVIEFSGFADKHYKKDFNTLNDDTLNIGNVALFLADDADEFYATKRS